MNKKEFTFIELFAGIGGFRMALEKFGGRCVFSSEINRFCIQTYKANFICNHLMRNDITKTPAEDIPKHNFLTAGFPCQPFSVAGVSKKISLGQSHGFLCEAQGTLFFEIARIIACHQPEIFLLENVKNLVYHNKGKTFQVIQKILQRELSYNVFWRIINAKHFVPQGRERIFIIGFKKKTDFDFSKLELPSLQSAPVLKDILHPENGSEKAESPYTYGKNAIVNSKYTLSNKLWSYLQKYAITHKKKGNGFGYGLVSEKDTARTLSARYGKDGSEILVKQQRKNPRRLTPRECARLMGFDKPGRSDFKIPVSDTQAYKQFGNAVVVSVVEKIIEHIA